MSTFDINIVNTLFYWESIYFVFAQELNIIAMLLQ